MSVIPVPRPSLLQAGIDDFWSEVFRSPAEQRAARYTPYGAAARLFECTDSEIVLAGPAGTGKTRGILEYVHQRLQQYAGARALIGRKTAVSLSASALVTFTEKVLQPTDGVRFFGGSRLEPAQFKYPNGSRLIVGGMDKASKVMSSEYDLIYINEATELTENDWEALTSRLRYGVMPYQQIVGDCNPDAPHHWLKRRAESGRITLMESRHEDNPRLYDAEKQDWTTYGAAYMAKLWALTGVRLLRLARGIWAAAEGMVYDLWDRALNLIDAFPIPRDWPRVWVIDFGYTHPFVWQQWAIHPDGRAYREREIYRTQRLTEDHARDILRVTADDPRPVVVICDHDAEDRATFERHTGLLTTPAYKAVSPGIQAVSARLRPAGDGVPRLLFLRDALVERDPLLDDRKLPTCTEEEVESYVWNTAAGRQRGEEPIKQHDHGLDATRYLVAWLDDLAIDPQQQAFILVDDTDDYSISPY